MDLLGVTEMSVEQTWKVSAAEVTLKGVPPDTTCLQLPFPGLTISRHS